MTRPVNLTNVFANLGGNQPAATLDANFTSLQTAINDPASYTNYAVDSGSANAYAITLSPAPSSQASLVGVPLFFKAGNANTAASTLNVNTLGAINIVHRDGSVLNANDITVSSLVCVTYDGTNYQLQSAIVTPLATAVNGLINGGGEFWQRGAGGSASIAVSASSQAYTADCWALTTGANQASTVSQQAGLTNGSQWCMRVQRNAAQTGTGAMVFEQPFELAEIVKYRGQTITVSMVMQAGANWSPTGGTIQAIIACGTGAAAKRGTTPYTGETAILTISSNLTTTITSYSGTSSSVVPTNTTQMTLYYTWTPTGTAGANDYFNLDDVMWNTGGTVAAFERRSYAVELTQCKRHFFKTFPYATAPAQNAGYAGAMGAGNFVATTSPRQALRFPTEMRVSPTLTTFNPAAADANWRDTGNTTSSTVNVITAATSASSCYISSSTAVAIGDYFIHVTADAGI